MSNRHPPTHPLLPISIHGLHLAVQGKMLLTDLNCSLTGTGITLIMGPNGAGKSLLLQCLHGLLETPPGTIRFGGQPLSPEVRLTQAMVFQQPVLLRRSVAANLRFVTDLGRSNATVDDLLARVGLAEKANQPARRLSGGEQQRLALARALACAPRILLLDEPTASLDPASVLLIEQLVCQARDQGTKVLLISHEIGQAKRLAEDVVFLHRGQITEHTAASQFFINPESKAAKAYLSGEIVL